MGCVELMGYEWEDGRRETFTRLMSLDAFFAFVTLSYHGI